MTSTGGCLCGKVQFEIDEFPMDMWKCHCQPRPCVPDLWCTSWTTGGDIHPIYKNMSQQLHNQLFPDHVSAGQANKSEHPNHWVGYHSWTFRS